MRFYIVAALIRPPISGGMVPTKLLLGRERLVMVAMVEYMGAGEQVTPYQLLVQGSPMNQLVLDVHEGPPVDM